MKGPEMDAIPEEIKRLHNRLGMERSNLSKGDEIIGMGWSTSMGHFIIHGEVLSIDGDMAKVRMIKDYYFSGGSFPRDEIIDVRTEYLKTAMSDKIREHVEFLDWFAGECSTN